MADTPIPRSYEQIVSDIVDSFIARTGISALKVGNPILSMIEAVAQSQMRNSQDTFNLLASQSLDHATGDALTQIAADEGLVRKNASASFGYVTFTDNAFTKVSTQLTAGASRGQSSITVNDITGFANGDSIIIGSDVRVISNVSGNTITLTGTLSAVHPIGTEVVKVQGSARTIPAGTSVGTGTINFTTVNSATIPAGYTSVSDVSVVCATEGTTGNVPASTINVINSTLTLDKPTVTNPYGFINGQDQETDDELRDRVRYARRNKQKGTPQAIQNAAIGVQSPVASGESKKVISASVADTGAGKASLYIDDGMGYEPITSSIGIETLTASATGGEKYFELQGGRPVAQCFVESGLTFPADFSQFSTLDLNVRVGGVISTVQVPVNSTVFANTAKATSYELVSWLNATSIEENLVFSAATRDNHTKVILFPSDSEQNTIEVTYDNALQFDVGYPMSSLYLFKNGILLIENTDYTLNRYRGQIYLMDQLQRGDSLTVGSVDVRAGIVTSSQGSSATYTNQYIWLLADDASVQLKEVLPTSASLTTSYSDPDLTITCTGAFADVLANDWLILWDPSHNIYWTKRVKSRGTNYIVVENDVNVPSLSLSNGGLAVFRTNKVPVKLSIPSYTNIDNFVLQLQQQMPLGIHILPVGTSKIGFYPNTYATGGAMAYLAGTSQVETAFGFSWENTAIAVNPPKYQASLVSGNSQMSATDYTQVDAEPSETDVGKISQFYTGEQKGFVTTQSDTGTFRKTLNDMWIADDKRIVSAGFCITDTDSLSVRLDQDDTKKFQISLAIDGKLQTVSSQLTVTTQDDKPHPFLLAGYSLNDFAVWSASTQTAQPATAESGTITYTSKLYGEANPITRVRYVYPQTSNSTPSYNVTNNVLNIVIGSGSTASFEHLEDTQRYWFGNYNNTNKTNELHCAFAGEVTDQAGKYLRAELSTYPDLNLMFDNECWVWVDELNYNFKVISVAVDNGSNRVLVYLNDPSNLITALQSVTFSVSKNAVANRLASFTGIVSGDLVNNSVTQKTYRVYGDASSESLVFRSAFIDSSNIPLWNGDNLSIFKVSDSFTTAENPFFSVTNPNVTVVVSTEDQFDFGSVGDDGLVEKTGSVDFVSQTSGPFVAKNALYDSGTLVRFVPVTAQNIADCIGFILNDVGAKTYVSSSGNVEIVREEAGADVSVEVLSGSGNSYSTTVTSLQNGYCTLPRTQALPFRVGFKVKISSGVVEFRIVDSIDFVDESTCKITFDTPVTASDFSLPVTLTAFNKLDFPLDVSATNSDGYRYYSGLLGEVNKVIYGDPTDPVNYPGYASANANIEVTAPQVKQVFLNIFVRMQSGFTLSEAKLAIRNAAAAAVNATPVGQDVAYSDVISAVNAINGVFAVAIEDNTTDHPTIPVLSYEKPLIIDLEKDINVTITGI